ncbi:PACE efflux transporter [Photobacterium sp. WH77]|uniref:PACE efflux transporter n=1 Tax=Photobacterium arenosum TaxID=2774143 RepID=A0ABR9BKA5_9GAMM|nr:MULTISPECIES: PACE efflux transporter [Photobacterium]MBD8512786.1 PACE efflux transporter [Photobacterium arenosum]MBV7261126.1 PACE efflux transporter [Photobacterium sp. WH24]MCG2835440.1 PACE efflux transporter [Photobacterium sp. WH77]MCG2843053.1 PACE efflux transporter [Photobacterium sp. WH80]
MRTHWDRIRHAVGFELIALVLITLVLSQGFGFDMAKIGLLGIVFSVIATVWNYVYNLWFDKAMLKYAGHVHKSTKHRMVHALGFELCLLWLTLPIMAWWLEIGLWQALVMDIGLVIFYLIYAYVYNLTYDKVFPLPETQTA